MKHLLLSLGVLCGCTATASEAPPPPTGEQVFKVLLEHGDIRLKSEPLCQVVSTNQSLDTMTLDDHLATVFSVSYASPHRAAVESSCSLSKFESGDKVIDAWDCKVQIQESTQTGEFVSNSTVAFGVTLAGSDYIAQSLRCL